jgi:putative Mg2+ transporter-C (MgtC) family protein
MTPSSPADVIHLAARLGLAVLLGSVLGFNRELRQKPAGLRTHSMVALGSALVTTLGFLMSAPGGDPANSGRVVQGLLAGIGFIGGGVILHRDDTRGVHGLTTAASVWLVAGLGIAAGAGLWQASLIGCVLALGVLAIGGAIDVRLRAIEHARAGLGQPPVR